MKDNKNSKLVASYLQWLAELNAHSPELLDKDYSNPYFISIPDEWFETKQPRILVVGEEGFGTWGCGKGDNSISAAEIEKIQSLNFNYLKKQLFDLPTGEVNNSAFWRRFRKVAKYGVCAWSNIDKIHKLGDKNCVLTRSERKQLHAVPTKILCKEIELLNPTHIIFFGWHSDSLKHELPELYAMMYPNGPSDSSVWNQTVVTLQWENRTYIFCYHPNWGYRNRGYEDKVIEALEASI